MMLKKFRKMRKYVYIADATKPFTGQESNGICSEHGKAVGQADACEFWRSPHEKRAATVRALDEAKKEVMTLQRLLKDE